MIQFYRSDDGIITGVSKGLAEVFEVPVGLIRLAFVILTFFIGSGIFLYFSMAFAFPRKDQMNSAYDDKLLGVCNNLALKFSIDVGLVRFLAILSLFGSIGITLLIYVLLKILLADSVDKPQGFRDLN